MQPTNNLLDIGSLDLLTSEEKEFNNSYVKKLLLYADGRFDGVHIRNLTAGAATIAKRQQSRSGIAMLKWSMAQKGVSVPKIENKKK